MSQHIENNTEKHIVQRIVCSFLDIYVLFHLRNHRSSAHELSASIRVHFDVAVSFNTVLKILHRLEQEGLIKKTKELNQRFYSLTSEGTKRIQIIENSAEIKDFASTFYSEIQPIAHRRSQQPSTSQNQKSRHNFSLT